MKSFKEIKLINIQSACIYGLLIATQNFSFAQEATEQIVKLQPLKITAQKDNLSGSEKKLDIRDSDANTILRSLSGVFTQHDIGQGGVAVNIRGVDGFGRVNTTIDGVSQTSFQNAPHGFHGNVAYIDENLVSTIESSKGNVSGTNAINSLVGAVNFKTINVEDIILDDKNYGSQIKIKSGNNGYGANFLLAGALKYNFDESYISLISAVSGKDKYGYKNAAGEEISSDNLDDTVAQNSRTKSRSVLNKIELNLNSSNILKISNIYSSNTMSNNRTPLEVKSNISVLEYNYNSFSDLIDFKTIYSTNDTNQNFINTFKKVNNNRSKSLTFENKSIFNIMDNSFEISYGAKLLNNRYKGRSDSILYSESLLSGGQEIKGLFINSNYIMKKLNIGLGARYEKYKLTGYVPPLDDISTSIIPNGGDYDFNKKESHFNPYINISYSINSYFGIYTSYTRNSRAPNVNEVMYAPNSSQPLSVNPFLRGETSDNFDVGLSFNKNSILFDNDHLFFKLNYYFNNIENYILQDQFYTCEVNNVTYICNLDSGDLYGSVGIYRNIANNTKMKGFEVDLNYDFDYGYILGSYTKSETDFPYDRLSDMGFSHISNLPSSYWNTEIAGRFFQKKLVTGFIFTYTGKDTIAGGVDSDLEQQIVHKNKSNPILIDLFAKYQVNKNVQLFLNIENLTNRLYNYPVSGGTLGTGNLGDGNNANQGTGRGRTFFSGISFRM